MRCLALSLLAACAPDVIEVPAAPAAPWPDWALSHWVWEDESTEASALALVDDYLAHDIPVGALILDSPWETGYNTFSFDPVRYPDPQRLVDELHARGVRVLLWIVPAVNTDVPELWDEGAANGWFMQTDEASGAGVIDWWKGRGSLLDYFNPRAVEWWHGLMANALAHGIDGWKTDGLDYSVWLSRWSPGLGERVDRRDYSERYYRDFFDTTRAALGDDRLIMARPVDNYGLGVGGEDVAFAPRDVSFAAWVGDQDATFAGMRAALDNLYESSLLGYVAIGSDIGGYRTDDAEPLGRSEELFLRWTQLGAFCPLMENGGGGEHRPWMFSERATEIYRRFVLLHAQLAPYLSEHGAAAWAAGQPLMRFVDETSYAFFLGPDLFVWPMLAPGESVEVTLPEGGPWIYLFGERRAFGAGPATLTVPLEEFPVFVRRDSPVAATLLR
jgi:alpha-glucosidase (family GH31 glycosyl hydrolase)